MKRCATCKNPKKTKEFQKNSSRPDGLQNTCRACRKEIDAVRVLNGSNKSRMVTRRQKQTANQKHEQRRRRRASHLHNFQARNRKHYQTHKLDYIMRAKNRRARVKNAQGVLTAISIQSRFDLYGNRCAYCHKDGILTIDHVKPLILGGSNWPANIVPACSGCNSGKQHRARIPHLPYNPKLPTFFALTVRTYQVNQLFSYLLL